MLRRTLQILALASAVLTSAQVLAQRKTEENSNLWISHWGDQRLSKHWSFHTEGHWRRANMGGDWQQLLLRPAINYHLNDQVILTQGYSYYQNYGYGDYPIKYNNWEHHLFQQVQLNGQAVGKLKITHRFRMEERFIASMIQNPENTTSVEGVFDKYTYQSRFRYRVWLTLPLGKHDKIEPGVFSANFYDEVFINFGDSKRIDYINQNRVSLMLGYQVNKPFSIMAGFLYQTIDRPAAVSGADLLELNNTLHIALVYNFDFRKPAAPAAPK